MQCYYCSLCILKCPASDRVPGMAQRPAPESPLIRRLLIHPDDELFSSLLLAWISGGSVPSFRTDVDQDPQISLFKEEMDLTTPSSFAISFLEYIRTESELVLVVRSDHGSKENEPRDALHSFSDIHVEEECGLNASTDKNEYFKKTAEENSYDAEFPALGFSIINTRHKTVQSQTRPKRRVNPTPTRTPVVDSAFVLAKIESNKSGHDNTAMMRSMAPVKVDALMRRCSEKSKSKCKTTETSDTCCDQSLLTDKRSSVHASICNGLTQTIPTSEIIPKSTLQRLRRFAIVHSMLITEKLVPSLIGELQYLFQLMCSQVSLKLHRGDDNTERKLFESKEDCSFYACILMEQLGRILVSVGEPVLSALTNQPVLAKYFPALQNQLKMALVKHQANALHSFKSYKSHKTNNSSESADAGMPVSLPFQAARDSRNNYKSRELQRLYNNRELCRDHFYTIIREVASVQTSFDCTLDDCQMKTQENVKTLMSMLLIENYPWFTEFFLEHFVQLPLRTIVSLEDVRKTYGMYDRYLPSTEIQLSKGAALDHLSSSCSELGFRIQVAMCGETDPVVTGLARQDKLKLQKLHDRLTSGQRNRMTKSSLSVNVINVATDSKDSTQVFRPDPQNLKYVVKPENWSHRADITKFFPPSLCIYVRIIEIADSYRLTTQMIWSIKSKISKLTEIPQHSRDAAEICSLLTQRVLSLKALASFLGFLCVCPGSGPQQQGFDWEISKTDPPIDVPEVIEKALSCETMLLTLPWILDFLRLMKLDQQAVSLPYFQKSVQALWRVYDYSLLDPKSENFGVPSICILASLERFFEFMDLTSHNINWKRAGHAEIQKLMKDATPFRETNVACGLDRIDGVVDTSYVQHCCPTLMELRMLLLEKQSWISNSTSKSSAVNGKLIRKITPVCDPKVYQSIDQNDSAIVEDVPCVSDDFIQMRLQRSFFEQRPGLQRLVDFVVDTIAVNAAQMATSKCVPPVLREALKKLEAILLAEPHTSMDHKEPHQENGLQEAIENIITSTIEESLIPAVKYAKHYTTERVSEALSVLANPGESSYVLGVAARIAVDAAGSAAEKKTLAKISCEIRKCITQEVECWRQSLHKIQKCDMKCEENMLVTSTATKLLNKNNLQALLTEEKENIMSPYQFPLLKLTSANRNIDDASNSISRGQSQSCDKRNRISSQLERMLSCFNSVIRLFSNSVPIENQRHQLRVNLAAVCTSMEMMISSECSESVFGGFTAVLSDSEGSPESNGSELFSRIETGLLKRCIVLSLGFCFLSPFQAFGYSAESLEGCTCLPIADSQYVKEVEFMDAYKKLNAPERELGQVVSLRKREESIGECMNVRLTDTPDCRRKKCIGVIMSSCLSMLEALMKNGICDGSFLISEFLSAKKWSEILRLQPWKSTQFWFEAVNHGMANILARLIAIVHESPHQQEKSYSVYLACLIKDFFVDHGTEKSSEDVPLLRRLVTCIFIELLHLQTFRQDVSESDQISPTQFGSEGVALISLVNAETQVQSVIDVVLLTKKGMAVQEDIADSGSE